VFGLCLRGKVSYRRQAELWSTRGSDVYTQSFSFLPHASPACHNIAASAGDTRMSRGYAWHTHHPVTVS